MTTDLRRNGDSVAFSATLLDNIVLEGEVRVDMREDGIVARANDLCLLIDATTSASWKGSLGGGPCPPPYYSSIIGLPPS